MTNRSLNRATDLRRFGARWWAILVAALAAQAAGDAGTALVRATTGISGIDSTALAERLLAIAFGIVPATLIVSWYFAGKLWSWAEAAVVAFAASWSFVTGPLIFALADGVLDLLFRNSWLALKQGSIAIRTPFWALGLGLVMAPIEYFVWRSYARERIRTIYAGILRATREGNSDDRGRAQRVRSGLRALGRVETELTTRLSSAVRIWAEMWLAYPEGLSGPPESNPADAVDREVIVLFGVPRSGL